MALTKTPASLIETSLDLSGHTLTVATQSASNNSTAPATTAYVTTALANLVDSAPGTLNTLNELAAALGDDANFSTTVTDSIATKLPLAGGTMTGDLILGDSVQIEFGAASGGDANIRHDGSNTKFSHTGSGGLYIGADLFAIQNGSHNENYLTAAANGSVQLYYDNSAKLATTSSGIDVAGNLLLNQSTSLIGINTSDGSDNKSVMLNGGGSGSDTRGAYVWAKGNEFSSEGGFLRLHAGNVSGGAVVINTAGSERMRITDGGDVSVGSDHSGFSGWRVLNLRGGSSGGLLNIEASDGTRSSTFAGQHPGIRYQTHTTGGYHRFETSLASNAFYIQDSGNVGIGTSSPGASIDVERNTNTVNNLDSLGFDVVGNIGNAANNPGNHYTSGLRLYQGSGTVGSGLGVMYLGADNNYATSENDYTGQITTPNGMSGGIRLNTFHNDAKIRFYTTASSSIALRMDIDHEGIDVQGIDLYASANASLTTTATDFYVNSTGAITTGTYILRIILQGGGWYSETHTGIMRWYSGTTNNPSANTIHLTGMGHANTIGTLNARVLRKYSNTNTHSIQLWLSSGSSSNHTITMQAAKIQD